MKRRVEDEVRSLKFGHKDSFLLLVLLREVLLVYFPSSVDVVLYMAERLLFFDCYVLLIRWFYFQVNGLYQLSLHFLVCKSYFQTLKSSRILLCNALTLLFLRSPATTEILANSTKAIFILALFF